MIMEKRIYSKTMDTREQFQNVYELIIDIYKASDINLIELSKDIDWFSYFFVKSHRSSVTEGNTTTVGEFTQLVVERYNKNENYVVESKVEDETYEIVNLKKVYDYLKNKSTFDRTTLQRAHAIIGENILKNNLLETRGRLKTSNNFVPFIYDNQYYIKVFSSPDIVRKQLEQLFENWNYLKSDDPAAIFAKFIILQVEIISIHPFNDGNGRVARAFSESYLETNNFVPYTPYSLDHKKNYQDEMGKFSVLSLQSLELAYESFANFILNSYINNANDLLEAASRVSLIKEKK